MRRCAVLGSPIAHSRSPALHRAAYAALGLTGWTYEAHEVADASGLARFLDGTWAGLSLTMPLKKVVLPLLDEVSPLAARVGAVNTVVIQDGCREGDNTDVPGIVAALRERGVGSVPWAVILGGGATARSAVAAVGELAKHIDVVARTPERAAGLDALAPSVRVLPWADSFEVLGAPLVVNTTPAGAADGLAGALPPAVGVLLDVVYAPWPTALAAAWADRGGVVASGLDMLLHQAARQVEQMTGVSEAPLGAMRAAVLAQGE